MTEKKPPDIKDITTLIPDVPGHIAEAGGLNGDTLELIARRCTNATIYGFDSWEGMGVPTANDYEHNTNITLYPKGRMRASFAGVKKRFSAHPHVKLVRGWVPESLSIVQGEKFRFVYLDMDQYKPTIEAARFFWPRMNPGGILAFDDCFPHRTNLAAKAIQDWVAETGVSTTFVQYRNRLNAVAEKGTDG